MRKKGRPSKQKQIQIAQILRPYYERGMTATFTARRTAYDIKTVCKYFDVWTKEIQEAEDKDFLSRQKKERERTLISLDYHVDELYKLLDDVNDEIIKNKKNGKGIPRYLFSIKLEIIKTISSLTEKKGLFTIEVPPDKVIEQKIEEMIKQHDPK
jgi:hypothetical protein